MPSMNQKKIATIVVGLALAALTAWKGPGVASAVVGALSAVCVLVGTLHVLPASAQSRIDELEAALEAQAKKEQKQ